MSRTALLLKVIGLKVRVFGPIALTNVDHKLLMGAIEDTLVEHRK